MVDIEIIHKIRLNYKRWRKELGAYSWMNFSEELGSTQLISYAIWSINENIFTDI